MFGEEGATADERQGDAAPFGEIKVYVQMFYGIPMQVKLTDGTHEERFALPERFKGAIMKLQMAAPNVVMERKWVEQSTRYGDFFSEIGNEVVEELAAAYPEERVNVLVEDIMKQRGAEEITVERRVPYRVTEEMMKEEDWTKTLCGAGANGSKGRRSTCFTDSPS
ncbi:hypothetical protein GCM10020331_065750 [Ectobacillus funiculus]